MIIEKQTMLKNQLKAPLGALYLTHNSVKYLKFLTFSFF